MLWLPLVQHLAEVEQGARVERIESLACRDEVGTAGQAGDGAGGDGAGAVAHIQAAAATGNAVADAQAVRVDEQGAQLALAAVVSTRP